MFGSISNPYLPPGSPAFPSHGKLSTSDEEKQSKRGWIQLLNPVKPKAASASAASLLWGRTTGRCQPAMDRTSKPLVDKVIPHSYRKTPCKRAYCTNTSNTGQQNLKGSKMLQLFSSISPLGRAQGHVPRGEKIPKLGVEKWHCRSAVKPGGQDILLGHTSGPRRMQEQSNTSQQVPETQPLSG